MATVLSLAIGESIVAYYVAKELIEEAIGVICGLILALVEIAATAFIEIYMKDEEDAGWAVYKDWEKTWLYFKCDMKFGGFMWIRYLLWFFPLSSAAYPLWYGGRELGHAGI